MKLIFLACLFTIALCYDDMFDKIDYEKFQKDIPLLQAYLNCFVDKAPCPDPESMSVKPHLKEIFTDSCNECSTLQKHHGHLFIQSLKDLLPEGLKEFKKKYDPDNKHVDMFLAAVAKY